LISTWVESAHNGLVAGSSPARPTNLFLAIDFVELSWASPAHCAWHLWERLQTRDAALVGRDVIVAKATILSAAR
jgi:hypothetical protein